MPQNKLTIAAFFLIFLVVYQRDEIMNAFSPPVPINFEQGDVVLYSTRSCGYCTKVKRLFEAHKVDFEELDIERSRAAHKQFKALGGRGVPVVVVKGQVVHGYNREKIISLLKDLGEPAE